ncbi:MAG: solute carrier family 23 protein, partial [Myxococcota bacterium]|nr:solute carrier family 23 protein [Myxococcota bacterium]
MSTGMRICPVCETPTEESTCPEHGVSTVDPAILKQFEQHRLEIGEVIAERYRVEGFLGAGGMGGVYKCAQLNIQRPVAVKTLKRELMANQSHMKRFYLEARAASQLDHPNIVRIYDYGVDETQGLAYIAMEYLPGESLRQVLKRRGRLPEKEACHLLSQVAKALVSAHKVGMVHRDLKPANVNIRDLAAGEVEAKVLDFGLAKLTEDDLEEGEGLTETGVALGTPFYMSPEQVSGKPVDFRSDLYSLGCVLYELLQGNRPYQASGRTELAIKHVSAPVPDLSKELVDGEAPSAGLRSVLRMLMAKSADHRPDDTELVAVALMRLSRGETVMSSHLVSSGEATQTGRPAMAGDAAPVNELPDASEVADLIKTSMAPEVDLTETVVPVSEAATQIGQVLETKDLRAISDVEPEAVSSVEASPLSQEDEDDPIVGYEMAELEPDEVTSSTRWDHAPSPPAVQPSTRTTPIRPARFTRDRGDSLMDGLREFPTELRAGLTTFLTMAYILFVNPEILGQAIIIPDVNIGAQLMTATALAAAIGCFVMGLIARYPIALAPGMGLNAYFAFNVVLERDIPWQTALGAVFLSGLAFIVLSLTGARAVVVRAIPAQLKLAVSAGIGLFLVAVAFKTSGVLPEGGATNQADVMLVLFGFVLTGALVWLEIPGGLVLGIIATSVASAYLAAPVEEALSLSGRSWVAAPVWPSDLVGALDVGAALELGLFGVVFIFLFVDFFDTAGTLVGLGAKAGYLDEEGSLPRANQAFSADAIATTVGSMLGTSTTTSYIESAAGISEGGRTGLTAIIVGLCFLASTV